MDKAAVEIKSIDISDDGKVVDLHLADLKAWYVHEVNIAGLKSAEGTHGVCGDARGT